MLIKSWRLLKERKVMHLEKEKGTFLLSLNLKIGRFEMNLSIST
jgi:hypothetical protein